MSRQTIGILVMLNNYFHDLASGMLLSSGFLAWRLWRAQGADPRDGRAPVGDLVRDLTALASTSFVWIVLGGIVRALAYREYEWSAAAGNRQVPALIAKHMVLFSTVGAGIAILLDLRRKVWPA